jgi:sirohydrochlorin cobaltochelatase
MQRGLILFAHGARDPRWSLPFEAVARAVQARDPTLAVQLAYLEFMTPGLVDAGQALVQSGCAQVDVVPLFLGAGGHVRKDLPLLLDELAAQHPRIRWRLRGAIGEVDSVIDAMAQAAHALTLAEGSP